jgi:hypothetical protein
MSAHPDSFEEGDGTVESVTKDKTEKHDEIVVRLKDGRRIVISNNTELGKRILPVLGSKIGYHGYRVTGTNVVHRTHPNRGSRGGWLEEKKAQYWGDVDLSRGSEAHEGQTVIVLEGRRQLEFATLEDAANYLAGVGMLPRSDVETMLRSREPLINGRQVSYPEG